MNVNRDYMMRSGRSYLLWRGLSTERGVDKVGKAATLDVAQGILERANEHVPFEFGTLKSTGVAQSVQARNRGGLFQSGHEAIVSYDTPYAVHLHEHPEYNFRPPGQGKWLENALRRTSPVLERGLAPRFIYYFKRPFP